MIAALAAGPPAPASAQACDIPTSGEYTLPGDCTLTGTIEVDGSLTVHGDGYTIDAAGNQAFAVLDGGSLALDNVTITNGYAEVDGGVIYNEGTVTISNSSFPGNSAGGWGGVIYNEGTMTANDSTFSCNFANYDGGVIYNEGGVTISNSTFSCNEAGRGGGVIYNKGTVTVSNSGFYGSYAADGGAISNRTASLTIGECSVFQGNMAGDRGDGIQASGMVDVTGSVIYDEVYHHSSAGSITAEGNWWGSTDGPGMLANDFTVDVWRTENPCRMESTLPECIAVMPFGTIDPAPINGEVRFFFNFGYDLPPKPEGWHSITAVEATAGEQTWGEVTVSCGRHVRAWLFDAEGNPVGLIPSQYENGDGVFVPCAEDYVVVGSEYGYLETAPPMYAGRYADMFGESTWGTVGRRP